MNYKYHHKVLELLYLKKKDSDDEDSRGKCGIGPEILPHQYSGKRLSEELKNISTERARSILTSLRESDCLNSRFIASQNDVFFSITDKGISRYHEHYFKYIRTEQIKEKWVDVLKLLFYTISTLGIITSIVVNIFSTQTILNKIERSEFRDTSIIKNNARGIQNDSLTVSPKPE